PGPPDTQPPRARSALRRGRLRIRLRVRIRLRRDAGAVRREDEESRHSLIDLNLHCLPGIDDGPADWDSAVALCREAAREGVTTIVATPHVLRGPWRNDSPPARRRLTDELNRRLGGSPAVLPGCEYYFCEEVLALVE